ncbi:uncharacterized protein [Halyomorpha halys]|uniref:uncharacterized protein n=1 Tax=Halyomorpha halys TaxID=286706 RepID=UPI0006D4F478|nr:uncharacterized protein LOC106687853 [Halyomorpha halys]
MLVVILLASMVAGCRISELMCRNGKCVPSDLYCNGINDCEDGSDEPKYCTVCNRTYYGESGRTYSMSLKPPRQDRLPFLCHITFTANGNEYGDIIQLVLDKFAVGRLDGDCQDGYMSVTELGRPFSEGGWCGEAAEPVLYYSESTTLTITLRVLHHSPFKFALRYKFLRSPEAVSRLGSLQSPVERGVHVPGSHCSTTFDECYRKKCQVQSPNYPGLYPRNVTCEYTIKQKTVPTCKHAMIAVRNNILRLRRSVAGLNKTVAFTKRPCSSTEDRILFFNTGDTLPLAEYCGGGLLPHVISRGPSLTVIFSSSPYASPQPGPQHGFSLSIDVIFADSDSLDFARGSKCEFFVNGTKSSRGQVVSPRHSLPPNITCSYRLWGASYHRVWIYFAAYTLPQAGANCSVRMKLNEVGGNLLEDTCGAPRLCDHSALRNSSRETRPCSLQQESYLSRMSKLNFDYKSVEGTAVTPANFKFYYEFVDTRLGGEGMKGAGPCARIFRRAKTGHIRSPRNVFMFGRGGAANLTCLYRLECAPGERIELVIKGASFGNNGCKTVIDSNTRQPICVPTGHRSVQLTVYDLPWNDIHLEKGCHCDNTVISKTTDGHVSFTSSGQILELTFIVSSFNVTEDFTDIYFEGTYRFVKFDACPRRQRVSGSGGEIRMTARPTDRDDLHCLRLPWLVEANRNRSLFLLTWGHFLSPTDSADSCHTTNRVLIYTGLPLKLLRVVCPATEKEKEFAVHVFSEDWTSGWSLGPPSFLVRLIGSEQGTAHLNWLEISRSRSFSASLIGTNGNASSWECKHRCPELDACISPALYCDGQINCPSGFDEDNPDCGVTTKLLSALTDRRMVVITAAGALIAFVTLLCLFVACRQRRPHPAASKPS